MTFEQFDEFSLLLDALGELHDRKLSNGLKKLYFAALAKYPLEVLQEAAQKFTTELKFFPKPADFVEMIEGNPQDKAENAWTLFVEAVRKGGYMKSLYCQDAAIVFAINRTFGGWFAACSTLPESEEPMFAHHKKTFVAMYGAGQREGCKTHYLPGKAEIDNASNGGLRLSGRATYPGQVVLIQEIVRVVVADFSTETGRLMSKDLLMLPGMGAGPYELLPGLNVSMIVKEI